MALPEPGLLCTSIDLDIDALLEALGIPLFAGAKLSVFLSPGIIPDCGDLCANLLGQLNAALAPMVPTFRIIDFCIQIAKCLTAVVDCLMPPSPGPLLDCLGDLSVKLDFLLEFIPQISVCLFIKAILLVLIQCLAQIVIQLENLVSLELQIQEGEEISTQLGGVAMLDEQLSCATHNKDLQLSALGNNDGLFSLVELLNIFMGMAGLPEIPPINDFDTTMGPSAIIDPLNALIDMLRGLANSLPC